MDAAKNFAKGTLAQGYDDTATSVDLLADDGARFPAAPFNAVWWNATDYPDPADDPDREIVRVTAVSTDTLTITRGAESAHGGGAAHTHELDGKTYKLIAPLTAKAINEEMLPVSKVGDDYEVDAPDALTFTSGGSMDFVAETGGFSLNAQAAGVKMDLASGEAGFGDLDGNNTGVSVRANDNLGLVKLQGLLGTDQKVSASVVPTAVNGKIQVFDLAGNSLGFICLYSSIT